MTWSHLVSLVAVLAPGSGIDVSASTAVSADSSQSADVVVVLPEGTDHPAQSGVRPFRTSRHWETVHSFRAASIQACRAFGADGWHKILLRIVNKSAHQVRKANSWYKDLEWGTSWNSRQTSSYLAPGDTRVFSGIQTTGEQRNQTFRTQIQTTGNDSTKRTHTWASVPTCPGA